MQVRLPTGRYGVVVARGCDLGRPAPELDAALEAAIAAAVARQDVEATTKVVRDLFRHGKYKPTGRGKPASEYLLKAARNGTFPRINTVVDINNLISLETMLPISVVDLVRAQTTQFTLRHGNEGESYVFNKADQVIGLEDLIVVSRLPEDAPCANAVKDSMATKLQEDAKDVMAVLYAPDALEGEVTAATARFADHLRDWAGATEVASAVLSPAG